MPTSTATITANQRKAIYELVRDHLSGLGDLDLALEHGELATAERLGRAFAQDLRLLADLGWASEDERRTVALTMPVGELEEALRRLRSEAAEGVTWSGARSQQDDRVFARFELVLETCDELIAGLDREGGEQR